MKTNHRKIALALSTIPGLGQFYNKQWQKGIIYALFGGAFIVAFFAFIREGIWGLITLGEVVGQDNSVFLLAEGIITALVVLIGIFIYVMNLRDAYITGRRRDNNERLYTLREQYLNLIDQGYPYVISGPAFFLLIFQ